MLEKYRKKAASLYKKNMNTENEEKYRIINDILKDDNCFMNMDIDKATSILLDLEVPSKDVAKTYIYLTMNR